MGLELTKSDIIDHIEIKEGWPKFTNDPADRGGPTKGGITLKTLRAWRGKPTDIEDVRCLTRTEARQIYEKVFIVDPGFSKIPDQLMCFHLVDTGVMSGPRRAGRFLQQAINGEIKSLGGGRKRLAVDGILGQKTFAALEDLRQFLPGINIRIAVWRIRFLGRLVSRSHSQAKWVNGWLIRATTFLQLEADRF